MNLKVLVGLLCITFSGTVLAASTPDSHWQGNFPINGTDGPVNALAVDATGATYVGGQFQIAGNVLATNVAKWDGASWSALGAGPGFSVVWALAVSGTTVYAAGDYGVAQWNGSTWTQLGAAMDDSVLALAVNGTTVYAGGAFLTSGATSVPHLAQWNGTSWSAVGGGTDDNVNALVLNGADLYAGGDFSLAGAVTAYGIAHWNGTAWSALDSGTGSSVYALAFGTAGLYVGGNFDTVGAANLAARRLALWDGAKWNALGTGLDDDVLALAANGGTVYAGGLFATAGGAAANFIASWNGGAWSNAGGGTDDQVQALAFNNGKLYAGGDFLSAGTGAADQVAAFDGSAWSELSPGMNNLVNAVAVSGGTLYAGGYFTHAGNAASGSIAQYSGGQWSGLGAGFVNISDGVAALWLDGSKLYAGGTFSTTGATPVSNIAVWDGQAWSALGSGTNGTVLALAMLGGNLYAGGTFTTAGGVAASNIARWNGTKWSALNAGTNSAVEALAVIGTNLYAGGSFLTADGITVNHVAKWDGANWSALGGGTDDEVLALAAVGTNLYAGGSFANPGADIAMWDGSAWSSVGGGMDDTVWALAASGTNLYAAGSFAFAGATSANRLARWDGAAWSAFGSGLNDDVYALAPQGGDIFAGGAFTVAGGRASAYIAHWVNSAPANTAPPSVTGTYLAGQVLTANGGTWTDAENDSFTLSYQWQRADDDAGNGAANLAGATNLSYTVVATDGQKFLSIAVTATDSFGLAATVNSAWTVVAAPQNTSPPVVSGTFGVGNTLATSNGAWTAPLGRTLTFTYQWQRATDQNGANVAVIGGAASSSYLLVAADGGNFVRSVVTANDGAGGTAAANSAWYFIYTSAPVIAAPFTASGAVGQSFTYQISASQQPTSFSAGNLPPGLNVDTNTGVISGTPTTVVGSPFSVALSATNPLGTGTATLVLTVNPPLPVINSVLTATGQVGQAFSYNITATNSPASFNAAPLPNGLSIDTSTGAISGTPTLAGTTTVTLSATNAGGTGTATLSLTISAGGTGIIWATPQTIAGDGDVSTSGILKYAYVINGGNVTVNGVSFTNATGGNSDFGVTNWSSVGTCTSSAAPWSGLNANTKTLAGGFSYYTGTTSTLVFKNLTVGTTYQVQFWVNDCRIYGGGRTEQISTPGGNTVTLDYNSTDADGGVGQYVLGTFTADGSTSPTITLTANSSAQANAFQVRAISSSTPAPVISSALTATGQVGQAFNYIITATNNPASFNATSLPAGLSVNAATGAISGTPTSTSGTPFSVNLSATNAGGAGTATLVLTIALPPPPVINSALTATGQVGQAFNYIIIATNNPASFNATGLPAGLSVSFTTGAISGTPTSNSGSPFSVSLSATNAGGAGAATLVLTITPPPPPVISSALTATGHVGQALNYTIAATNSPASFNAAGLPAGLSVNTSTGAVSGAPTHVGTANVTLSATNAGGTGTGTLALTIAKGTPVITWSKPVDITYGTALGAAQLNASAAMLGTFVYTPASGVLEAGPSQTLRVDFTPQDGADYNAASMSVAINVLKQAQTITFAALPEISFGDPQINLSATADSGLHVTIALVSGPAILSGGNLSFTGAGVVTLTASQAGSNDYNPAPDVTQSFIVAMPLTVSKLSGTFNFIKTGKDTCALTGTLNNVAAGTAFAHQTLEVNIGGAQASFQLGSKFNARTSSGAAALKPKFTKTKGSKKPAFNGTVLINVKLKGPVVAAWQLDPDETFSNRTLPLAIELDFAGIVNTANVSPLASAKAGKGGKFKEAPAGH